MGTTSRLLLVSSLFTSVVAIHPIRPSKSLMAMHMDTANDTAGQVQSPVLDQGSGQDDAPPPPAPTKSLTTNGTAHVVLVGQDPPPVQAVVQSPAPDPVLDQGSGQSDAPPPPAPTKSLTTNDTAQVALVGPTDQKQAKVQSPDPGHVQDQSQAAGQESPNLSTDTKRITNQPEVISPTDVPVHIMRLLESMLQVLARDAPAATTFNPLTAGLLAVVISFVTWIILAIILKSREAKRKQATAD